MTHEEREGWLAWAGIVVFALVYGLVTLWVLGLLGG